MESFAAVSRKRKLSSSKSNDKKPKKAAHSRRSTTTHNERMHPRNPYRNHPPDFAALARQHPSFAKVYAYHRERERRELEAKRRTSCATWYEYFVEFIEQSLECVQLIGAMEKLLGS